MKTGDRCEALLCAHGKAQLLYPSPPYRIGQRVRTAHGVGVIEFIAYSNAMESPVYTVALDSRIKLRLTARDLTPEKACRPST